VTTDNPSRIPNLSRPVLRSYPLSYWACRFTAVTACWLHFLGPVLF